MANVVLPNGLLQLFLLFIFLKPLSSTSNHSHFRFLAHFDLDCINAFLIVEKIEDGLPCLHFVIEHFLDRFGRLDMVFGHKGRVDAFME